jgi:hypothetical protein
MNKHIARVAGLLYLVVVVTGIVSLAWVPSQIDVAGDAAATVANVRAHDALFRFGVVAGLACYAAFLLLPLALYRLLHHVDKRAAVTMVALAVASVPVSIYNLHHKLDVLALLGNAAYLGAFTPEQIAAQVMLQLAAYGNGVLIAKLFWGLWLLPFGYLVFRSGMLPRVLGVLLMAGCFGYLLDVTGRVMFPAYPESALAGMVTLPAALGEIGTCLWLLVAGARPTRNTLPPPL